MEILFIYSPWVPQQSKVQHKQHDASQFRSLFILQSERKRAQLHTVWQQWADKAGYVASYLTPQTGQSM